MKNLSQMLKFTAPCLIVTGIACYAVLASLDNVNIFNRDTRSRNLVNKNDMDSIDTQTKIVDATKLQIQRAVDTGSYLKYLKYIDDNSVSLTEEQRTVEYYMSQLPKDADIELDDLTLANASKSTFITVPIVTEETNETNDAVSRNDPMESLTSIL